MAKFRINKYDTYEFHLAEAKRLARLINKTLITPRGEADRPNDLYDLSKQFERHLDWLRANVRTFRATKYKAFLLSPQGLSKALFDMPKWLHFKLYD